MVKQGSKANKQGKILENAVESLFGKKGFEIVPYSRWIKKKEAFGKELLLTNVPFETIYNQRGYTEFVIISEKYNCQIRIECKWQQSSGSVDEKFPYLYLNCLEKMDEDKIIIICDGGGAKPGSIQWLKDTAISRKYAGEINEEKTIEVFSLTEFIVWANNSFPG